MREDKEKPQNMLVVSQDDIWVEKWRRYLWAAGYFIIRSDLRDAFLSFREINYQVVLTETNFASPEMHPDDLDDEEFPGRPLPLKDAIARLRHLRDSIRVIACGPEFANLSPQEYIAAATGLGCDALIEKPFEPDKLIDLLGKLVAVREAEKQATATAAAAAEDEDEENPVG